MHSLTEENYLKAIFNISEGNGSAGINELSQSLFVKMPTATGMVKKLAEKGLVIYESYRPLRLTETGKKAAALIIRKHRLTEMFLVEKMNFGWEEVHEIAEQIEHIQSSLFFDKMAELLDYPDFDPHGSPIPDKFGNISPVKHVRLMDCIAGQEVVLAAVIHSSDSFLKFLNTRGLKLGTPIFVHSIEDFDHSMIVSFAEKPNEMLSRKVCERLLVEEIVKSVNVKSVQ